MFGRPQLLHRASTLVVVAKPSGWLVHPAGTDRPDVMAWLESQGLDGLVPVHRLDAETSGVTLFAPRSEAGRWGEAFATGQVEKRYLALVFGHPRAKGIVRRALSDGRRGRALEAVSPLAVLERGYSITRRADGSVVRGPEEVAPGDALTTIVAGGEIDATVTGSRGPAEEPSR